MPRFSGQGYAGSFNLGPLLAKKEAQAKQGLAKAAIFLVGELKRDVGRPGPSPTPLKGKRLQERERLLAEAGESGLPSKPGEPPKARTHNLQISIDSESLQGGLVQRIGTPFKYGFWLEFGTVDMLPRPWLRPGLRRNADRLREFVVAAMRG